MKKVFMVFAMMGAIALMSGCGAKVEVPPAYVGKVMGSNGYKEGVLTTSKFRLDPCFAYCDKLVLLDVSDKPVTEKMKLFMPKDKLEMDFDIRLTLAVVPSKYEQLFNKIPPTEENGVGMIALNTAYQTYAQPIIRTIAREYLSEFSVAEVASNREAINAQIADLLTKRVSEGTPFVVKYAGLADVKYPPIITKAQENAAERREDIQQEEAQLEINKVQLKRQLQEAQMQRAIDVEKAEAEAQVNHILSKSMTASYVRYRELEVLEKLSQSDNKVFIPASMIDSLAGQVMIGNSK